MKVGQVIDFRQPGGVVPWFRGKFDGYVGDKIRVRVGKRTTLVNKDQVKEMKR